ncbi:MAG: tetratricopeptide repeat protein [Desulfobaccales bacterium]|jgi:tetratricopeptide (TPR) repeat protein
MAQCRRTFRARVGLAILSFGLALSLSGCASLALGPGAASPEDQETSKGLAYYHYFQAQQMLLAEDEPGAIREYEEALKQNPESAHLELELASLYQRQGDIKKALAHVEKALKLDPQQQEGYFLLAGLHVGLNQLDEAIREYEHILVLDPDNREARLFLATLYAQQSRFPQAIRTIQEILRLEPDSVVGHYYLGRFFLATDHLVEAKQELNKTLSLDPQFVPAIFDLASILEREKQFNRALAMYRRVLRSQPNNPRAWGNIGRLLLILNRYGEAQKAFATLKEFEKDNPMILFNIGIIFLEQKLPDDAIKELRPLLTNPHFQDRAHYYIALALEEKGDNRGALREYQLVGRESEQFVLARIRMAYLQYHQGDKERARQILEDLRKLAPDQEEVYLTSSYFYEEEGLWDRAIEVLKQGLEKVGRSEEIYFRLAMIYDKKQERNESITYIKKVLEINPDNPDAQNFLGYTYAEQGINLDEAERLIRAALQAKPDSGQIIDSLGWVYYKKGQLDKALVELERAHRLMPQDGTVTEHLADVYLRLQRNREALRLYRRALGQEDANPKELHKKIDNLEQLLQGSSL